MFRGHELGNFIDRREVHEVSGIHGDVSSKFFVSAQVASPHVALVFDIVNHQTSIVNNLCEPASKIYVFVSFKIIQICAAEALSKHKAKKWSPLFALTVE